MPNWCFTQYVFSGPQKELERLERNITKWMEKNAVPNGFGKDWLGNIVAGAGFDYEKVPCRGMISNLYMISDRDSRTSRLYIDTETAWCPTNEMWDLVIQKYAPHTSYLYYAEEPGCGIYETNDIFRAKFDFDYIVDSYYDSTTNEEMNRLKDYFPEGSHGWKEKDLYLVLSELLQKTGKINDLIDLFQDRQNDREGYSFISIHEVDRIDSPISNTPYKVKEKQNAG